MGDDEFTRTWLVRSLEAEMGINVPRYLREHYWSRKPSERKSTARIAYDLGVSATTVGRYLRQLGWSRLQAADRAWEATLLPDAPYTALKQTG